MPPKRCATVGTHTGAAKRQKAATTASQAAAPQAAVNDLTMLNAMHSPLLRFPAELRNLIWKYTFDRSTEIEVEATGESPPLLYTAYFVSESGGLERYKTPHFPQPASKQYWAEALHAYMFMCTFEFGYVEDFSLFTRKHPVLLPSVRRIRITCTLWEKIYGRTDDIPTWADTLKILVEKYTHLQGLTLDICFSRGNEHLIAQPEVMSDPPWKILKLPVLIRAFQQQKLEADSTEVNISMSTFLRANRPDIATSALKRAIIAQLLDYRPRQLSKQGMQDASSEG